LPIPILAQLQEPSQAAAQQDVWQVWLRVAIGTAMVVVLARIVTIVAVMELATTVALVSVNIQPLVAGTVWCGLV
jgi:hypothetical protein